MSESLERVKKGISQEDFMGKKMVHLQRASKEFIRRNWEAIPPPASAPSEDRGRHFFLLCG